MQSSIALSSIGGLGRVDVNGTDALAVLYAFRLLSGDDVCESLARRCGAEQLDAILSPLGISRPPGKSGIDAEKLRRNITERLAEVEAAGIPDTVFTRNLGRLSAHVGLSPLESEILGLAALFETWDWLYRLGEQTYGGCSNRGVALCLASLFHCSFADVRRALWAQDARLAQCGLLDAHGPRADLPDKLQVVPGLADALLAPDGSPVEHLLSRCMDKKAAKLEADDFVHLSHDFNLAERLIRKAAKNGARGINLLIYGPPGTGKTEFVRTLAAKAGLDLWEVGNKGEYGSVASGRDRFMHLRLSQALLGDQSRAAILFDEFEDMLVPEDLNSHSVIFGGKRKIGKAALNDVMESNRVPTFWISNEPLWMGAASRRRFTHVIEMPEPPRSVNERIFARELAGYGLGADWVGPISADERLVPAYAERVRRVLEQVEPADPEEAARIAERVLFGCVALTRQGGKLHKDVQANAGYRLGFLNADCNLHLLTHGIVRQGQGRVCLAGPPGTGKSAFAHYLACRLGQHLLIRRGSDLLGMFVGETERRIAEAFAKAERDGAVLLMDEVEGLLQARSGAHQSWQITQVNEILTQLEAYRGVFVATTNLVQIFDPAVQRRFDVFVKFDYLRSTQAIVLLRTIMRREHGTRPVLTSTQRGLLAGIPNLTPGDFAAVAQRAKLLRQAQNVDWWIEALARDAASKPDAPKAAPGFLAMVS